MAPTERRGDRIARATRVFPRLMQGRHWTLVAAACAVIALAASGTAAAKSPGRGFFGVDAWSNPSNSEFARMGQGKVGVYRMFLNWSQVESRRGCRDWTGIDRVVGDAASNHVAVLPFVYGSPAFLEPKAQDPPLGSDALKDYANFLHDLVVRYGHNGDFWLTHPLPQTPLAGVQVWNEPSHPFFWSAHPKASEYVKLLKASAKSIRSTDPAMKVVLAGIPNVGAKPLVDYVKDLYKVSGFRKAFDVMAIHPYAVNAQAIFDTLKQVRSIMSSHHDGGKQTWITETGWASNHAKYFGAGSPKAQAKILTRVYRGLIDRRKKSKIGMVVWFAWRDRKLQQGEKDGWVTHTGLFKISGGMKPAWKALVRITGGQVGRGPL